MKTSLILLLTMFALCSYGQTVATRVTGDSTATNSFVASTKPQKVFLLTGYSATTQYIMVFGTNTVPANGAKCNLGPFPVSAGQFYSIDFGYYGADLDAVTVCNSTTVNTLTIGAADCTFQAVVKR